MTGQKVFGWGVAGILTILYAYAVLAAVGNLIGMGRFFGEVFTPFTWAIISAGIAVPILAFTVALLLGRGKSGSLRILLLIAGLCVSGAMHLNILHLMG